MASASIAAAASKALAPAAAAAAAGSSAFFTHDIGVNFGSKKRYSDGAVARLMSEAWEGGVACVISITNCLSELPRNEALAARHEHLYFTVGVHPHSARGVTQESLEAAITRAVALPKCVAIGECGLDYDRMFSPQDEQLRVFRWQVALAKALDKPLYLHCRSKTGRSEAFHDMIGIMEPRDVPADAPQAVRVALTKRCGALFPPGPWILAAASAGVSGADAFLCHLSSSVASALDGLAASAETARTRIQSVREVARSENKSHCDELEVQLASAESTKRVELERELCAVDAALERLRAERGAVAAAAASCEDDELVARHAELTARLDAADALLLALPTAVVEPPFVGLVIDEPALRAGIAVFGRVLAPPALTAGDIALEDTPHHAYPGYALKLRFVLTGARHASRSAEELEMSLGAAAAGTLIEASLKTESAEPRPLQVEIGVDLPGRRLVASILIPSTSPFGSSLSFGPLTVYGQQQPAALLSGALLVMPPGPADLLPEHAAQLQAWLPPGGSDNPGEWEEVYRATAHGFGAKAFHERCDGRARLLLLVRAREGGWLFGGFTAVGFSSGTEPPPDVVARVYNPQTRFIADPCAFLYSLTNSMGHPEKLASKQMGRDLRYQLAASAIFGSGNDLAIVDCADARAGSVMRPGTSFAASASPGAHPMAQGRQDGWLAAEVVTWVV